VARFEQLENNSSDHPARRIANSPKSRDFSSASTLASRLHCAEAVARVRNPERRRGENR
jgi:hypothetical protein